MMTNTAKIEIVAEALNLEAEGKLVKSAFAKEKGISSSSLSRYLAKFRGEAEELNEKRSKIKEAEDKKPTKKDIAEEIFQRMEGAKRKDVIEAFMKEADLTKNGAATYYYNITKEVKDNHTSH